jgi:hypothetical protein
MVHRSLGRIGPEEGSRPGQAFEAARYALGDTLRAGRHAALRTGGPTSSDEPRADARPTGYALVDPGREYLVLQPSEKGGSFTVTLEAGTYAPQWHDLTTRETRSADHVTVERGARASFVAPSVKPAPAVLHLSRVAG